MKIKKQAKDAAKKQPNEVEAVSAPKVADYETGNAYGKMEIEFRMSGNYDKHNLAYRIAVKQVQSSKQDIETKLRAYVLKKLMLALREELSGILQDGDKMLSIVRNAQQKIKKEYLAFVGKEAL